MFRPLFALVLGVWSVFSALGDGAAPYVAPAGVFPQQVLEIPGSGRRVVLWTATGWDGSPARFYAVSREGQAYSRPVQTSGLIYLKYATFDPLQSVPQVSPPLDAASAGGGLFIVQYHTPPMEEYRQAIRAAGGAVYIFLPSNAHIVRMSPAAAALVAELPFVRWVGPFHPAYKLDAAVRAEVESGSAAAAKRYWIQVFERGLAQQQAVAERIRAAGGVVEGLNPAGFRMDASLSPRQVGQVAWADEVLFIEPWGPAEADLDLVRIIGGAAPVLEPLGFLGQGVRGEVMDGGIRTTHVSFQDPPVMIHGVNTDNTQHGTECYGCVFSSGAADQRATGLLPRAEQGIFASWTRLLGFGGSTPRQVHTAELVDPEGPYRAVFQSNSWGSPHSENYTTASAEMDDILFHTDLVLCNSMGNLGWRKARPEAWAKNSVACGGIYHQDTLTRRDDYWNFGASIGPAADGRIKPDLAHFYDRVYTTTNAHDGAHRDGFGGTSAATAITAGHFGLLFQMWHEQVFAGFGGKGTVFDSRPHMTTAKALLINTAYRYPFNDPEDDLSRFKQGWGMADLATLYRVRNHLRIVDESAPLEPLGVHQYRYELWPQTPELMITLVYADPMGNPAASQARINDLTLKVTSPSGEVYWGNQGLAWGNVSVPGGGPNTVDTVENVFIVRPEPGTWLVEVRGDEIVEDSHLETPDLDADYALVVRYGCEGDLDGDGDTDQADLATLIASFGSDAGGDLDGDGDTDQADLALLLSSFGCASR